MTIAARRPPHSPAARDALLRIKSGAAAVLLCACGLAQAQQTDGPPAGMVTGAYGQSLQLQQTTATPTTVAATATPQAKPGPVAPADAVSRFLKERGILAQAQGESGLLDHVRDSASDLVLSAMNFLGVRYTRGGNTASTGFDCSGFTRHIFEMSIGLVLPRRADEQAKMNSLMNIKRDELKPGDLVFFNTMRATFSHVGIYVGEGKFVHAPRTGAAVRVDDMREAYWAKRFTGARRAADVHSSSATTTGDTALR
ncbi:C40 family peptidase [Paucibacter sp. R3-3]|uniref:C40 family peptidase n=1 Tax=Roseateles agri TaxID=3098619 RepID=A0ABU5DJF4_9BURK|nr:C40 family peptidase [Paucibacter sp. R3-3]MDY0745921.1 C40 family peptidase [Paucibacter sp. R3-3]